MSIYKKFTAQDFAIVPFNAHKQYDFTEELSAANQITFLTSSWTSESIDIYSSGSTVSYGLPIDNINTVKYSQLDHLFYKNYKKDINNKFGNTHYLNQKRELYEKANILSIPAGLYGFEVKPGSFYLNFLGYEIVDDLNGNLIISGTNIDNYPTDIRSNIFKLDPIKGFRNYDLNTFEGYAIPFENDGNTSGVFWRDGKSRANLINTYSSPDQGEYDDSYFFNPIKYNNVTFTTSSISLTNSYFTNIHFNANLGSNIISPDNEKFDLNQDEDFSISFNVVPQAISTPEVGDYVEGGYVFHVSGGYAYVVADEPIIRPSTPQSENNWSTHNNIPAASIPGTDNTNYTNLIPTISDGGQAGSPNYVMGATTSSLEFRDIGGGETNTLAWKAAEEYITTNTPLFPIVQTTLDLNYNGFDGWWIPNYDEWEEIIESLYTERGSFPTISGNAVSDIEGKEDLLGIYPLLLGDNSILQTTSQPASWKVPLSNNHTTNTDAILGVSPFISFESPNWTSTPGERQHVPSNININDLSVSSYIIWPVRKFSIEETLDNKQRHIISKSTTKTIIPSVLEGQAQLLNTKVKGSSQFKDVMAQPQFPFEIYMVSQSLYFDRSDGDIVSSLNILITGSDDFALNNNAHVLCQKSGSNMEIYFNGNLITSSADATIKQTQNSANIYIGSKGILSETESTNISNFRYFNGKLGNINIFEEAFNITTVANISESVNGSPYIGNMFYQNGFATITHPKYNNVLLEGSSATESTNELINGNFVETFGTPELLTSGSLLFPPGPEEVDLTGPISIQPDLVSTTTINNTTSVTFTGYNANPGTYIEGITPTLENGETYTFSYTLSGFTDRVGLLGGGVNSYTVFADGTYTGTFISDGTNEIAIYVEYDGTNPVVGTISDISIKREAILTDDSGADIFPLSLSGCDFEYLPGGQFKFTNNTGGSKNITFRQPDLGLVIGKIYTIKVDIAATDGSTGNITVKNLSNNVNSTIPNNGSVRIVFSPDNISSLTTVYFTFVAGTANNANNDMKVGFFLPNGRSATVESISMKESLSNWGFDDLDANADNGYEIFTEEENNGNNDNSFKNFILSMDGNNANTATNPALLQTVSNLTAGETYKIEWDLNGGSWKFHVSEDILTNSYVSTGVQTTNSSVIFTANDTSVNFYIEAIIVDQEFEYNFPNNISFSNISELKKIQFQGSHLIYEHEYQCTVEENEFNDTMNISARKTKSLQSPDLANFATGSLFKPYVTTIGLYNEDNELLVVGKLGQPIRTSDETDTTFILRWDT